MQPDPTPYVLTIAVILGGLLLLHVAIDELPRAWRRWRGKRACAKMLAHVERERKIRLRDGYANLATAVFLLTIIVGLFVAVTYLGRTW